MKSLSFDENFCIIQLVQVTEKSLKTTEKQISLEKRAKSQILVQISAYLNLDWDRK